MEIVHIEKGELSYFYRHWMVVTEEDMTRYLNYTKAVSLRQGLRDLYLLGRQRYYEAYFDARLQASRMLYSESHSYIFGDNFTEDVPDPNVILDEFEDSSNWLSQFYFDYLLAIAEGGASGDTPTLTRDQIELYGRILCRTHHSFHERQSLLTYWTVAHVPQIKDEWSSSFNIDLSEYCTLGGLFIEANALELFKRSDPSWRIVLSLFPDAIMIVR